MYKKKINSIKPVNQRKKSRIDLSNLKLIFFIIYIKSFSKQSNPERNRGIMFKKLKSQVQEAVTQGLKPLSPSQPSSNAGDLGRSRTNSFSSVTSDSTIPSLFGNYTTPQRKYYPPSDVESEIEDSSYLDSSINLESSSSSSTVTNNYNNEAKKLNKLLDIYKNKFNQLKEAYSESEAEKEKIKVILIIISYLMEKFLIIDVEKIRKY